MKIATAIKVASEITASNKPDSNEGEGRKAFLGWRTINPAPGCARC
jgi:hypothetical protein